MDGRTNRRADGLNVQEGCYISIDDTQAGIQTDRQTAYDWAEDTH